MNQSIIVPKPSDLDVIIEASSVKEDELSQSSNRTGFETFNEKTLISVIGFNQDNQETDLFASHPFDYVNILMNLDFRFFHNISLTIDPEIQQSYLKMKEYIIRIFTQKSKRLFKIKKSNRAKIEDEYFIRGNSYRFKEDETLFRQQTQQIGT